MAKRLQSYSVYANIEIECAIDIRAESLEDAVDKARTLKETDFVTVLGEFCDGGLVIKGMLANTR